ncbi:hypothetical protein Tco_0705333 [Tanacetum coccineum]|uniref:Uncharacterized protein n=1 Tax=Tanacetum coccineum TaxID=301880 RepID=A0ABQ4Y6B7_9ASTR
MTTPITTSTTDSQMHNNIMPAGSRDRPPMLATGRYAQWQSRFLIYIDTRPNGDALRKCILQGHWKSEAFLNLSASQNQVGYLTNTVHYSIIEEIKGCVCEVKSEILRHIAQLVNPILLRRNNEKSFHQSK